MGFVEVIELSAGGSTTIEIIDDRGKVLALGRYGNDKAGYAEMPSAAS